MRSTRTLAFTVAALVLAASPAAAAFLKGPYLQSVSRDGVTVCFETDAPGEGTVEWWVPGIEPLSFAAPHADSIEVPTGTRYIYKLRIQGLAEGTVFSYRVSHGAETSDEHTFMTAPGNVAVSSFVLYGDSRGGSAGDPNLSHEAVADAIAEDLPMFYVNTGDFVADGGTIEDWDYFFEVEGPILAEAPLFPVYGNHEHGFNPTSGFSGARLWHYYFDTPSPDGGTWFSFNYGNIHFVVLDPNNFMTALPGAPQYMWLLEDLAAYRSDGRQNFLVAIFHQPAFTWKEGRTPDPIARLIFEPILRVNGVDLFIAGHDHFYARCELNGIQNVVTGGGGAPLYDFYPGIENRPGYRAHAKDNHIIRVEANPETLTLTAVSTTTGAVIDTFEVDAKFPPKPEDEPADDADDSEPTDDDQADDDLVDDAGDDTEPTVPDAEAASDDAGRDGGCGW